MTSWVSCTSRKGGMAGLNLASYCSEDGPGVMPDRLPML